MDENKPKDSLTKEETMSMISHELRTSLTASKWMLEMLQDGDVGELTISQKEVVAKLAVSNARMMDVANNLIMFSKTSTEEGQYHMAQLDIIDTIDSVVFEMGSEAFEQHIEMVFVKPEEKFPEINGDESKLRIVFQNIIDNAIKYTNKGGHIVISLIRDDNYIIINVKDTGIGIDNKDISMITTEFYRAPNATQKASAGSGIGLYICKRIVEAHKGSFELTSEINKGTTVHIKLPISK